LHDECETRVNGARVLVVEDEIAVRDLIAFHLMQAGFSVVEVSTLHEAWAQLGEADAVVLDWMLPDGSGIDWLRQLRQTGRSERLPVLMLTARASERDKVFGLDAGSDDYLVKPFSAAELVARLRALLRRTEPARLHRVGVLELDERQGTVRLAGAELSLTRREFDLLAFLCAAPGRVFSRTELLDRVWGEDFLGTERTVDQHIAQLRALVGTDLIETVRGRGYRLKAAD
jgi:DNA-binding response OmpR family regulator